MYDASVTFCGFDLGGIAFFECAGGMDGNVPFCSVWLTDITWTACRKRRGTLAITNHEGKTITLRAMRIQRVSTGFHDERAVQILKFTHAGKRRQNAFISVVCDSAN